MEESSVFLKAAFDETLLISPPLTDIALGGVSVHYFSDMERIFYHSQNLERTKVGLQPYAFTGWLNLVAKGKAAELAGGAPFSHTNPDGSAEFVNLLNHIGVVSFQWAGENIAMLNDRGTADQTAQDTLTLFMNSPGHKANILDTDFTLVGVSAQQSPAGLWYWAVEFLEPAA